jgi:imidazolonepropionase-like amidohydrolase
MHIARGADWIKVYADYRYGPGGDARPTFSQDELTLIVRVAHDAGVPVAAHATTAEGMRRAALAGVQTIEHGNEGTPEVFALMAQHESRTFRRSPCTKSSNGCAACRAITRRWWRSAPHSRRPARAA